MREPQLGLEQIAVGIERIEERVDASLVPHVGQTRPILQRRDEAFPLFPNLPHLLTPDERVGHLAKRGLDRAFVSDERELLLRLGQPDVGAEATCIEDWLRHLGRELPHPVGTGEEAGQLVTLKAKQPCEADAGKVCGLRDADHGVGGHQILLGRAKVRAPLEQPGRQSWRYFRVVAPVQ